jgi:hypothetical protein
MTAFGDPWDPLQSITNDDLNAIIPGDGAMPHKPTDHGVPFTIQIVELSWRDLITRELGENILVWT